MARVPVTEQEIVQEIARATVPVIALAIVLAPAIEPRAEVTVPKVEVTAPRAPAIGPRVLPRAVATAPRPPVGAIAQPRRIELAGPLEEAAGATTHSQAGRQGALPTWHPHAAR